MQHLAIFNQKFGNLLEKIACGEKTVESRWYQKRTVPWGKITTGDLVFCKNTGFSVSLQFQVASLEQIDFGSNFDLEASKNKRAILDKHYSQLGLEKEQIEDFWQHIQNKRYCLLISLSNVKILPQPFEINKRGFGLQSSWICLENIQDIART